MNIRFLRFVSFVNNLVTCYLIFTLTTSLSFISFEFTEIIWINDLFTPGLNVYCYSALLLFYKCLALQNREKYQFANNLGGIVTALDDCFKIQKKTYVSLQRKTFSFFVFFLYLCCMMLLLNC